MPSSSSSLSECNLRPCLLYQPRPKKWEPEPLRWLGINTMLRLPVGADRYEERTGKTEKWRSKILEHFIGH